MIIFIGNKEELETALSGGLVLSEGNNTEVKKTSSDKGTKDQKIDNSNIVNEIVDLFADSKVDTYSEEAF